MLYTYTKNILPKVATAESNFSSLTTLLGCVGTSGERQEICVQMTWDDPRFSEHFPDVGHPQYILLVGCPRANPQSKVEGPGQNNPGRVVEENIKVSRG